MVRMESVMLITIIAIKYSNKTKNNTKSPMLSSLQPKKRKIKILIRYLVLESQIII